MSYLFGGNSSSNPFDNPYVRSTYSQIKLADGRSALDAGVFGDDAIKQYNDNYLKQKAALDAAAADRQSVIDTLSANPGRNQTLLTGQTKSDFTKILGI